MDKIICEFTSNELSILKSSLDTILEDGIQSPFSAEAMKELSDKLTILITNNNVK